MTHNELEIYEEECRKVGIQIFSIEESDEINCRLKIKIECLSDKTPEYDEMSTMNLYDEDELLLRYNRMIKYSYLDFENVKLEILKYT